MLQKIKDQTLTFVIFMLSSALICFNVYKGIPFFMNLWNLRFGEAYLFCFYSPFVILFLLSFVLFKIEGHQFTGEQIRSRFRIHKLNRTSLFMLLLFFVIVLIGFFLTSFIGQLLSDKLPLFSIPDLLPAGLNHNKTLQPGYFFDVPIAGNGFFILFYGIGWFFNIFGEELLFRGILLPLNEKSFGRKAWIFQGILWGFWHIFWFWQFLPLTIFVSLPLVFAVQRSRNTLIGIIIHGTLNLIPLIYMLTIV